MIIKSSYTVRKWDEKLVETHGEIARMNRASVEFVFSGVLEGKASVEYVMFYKKFDDKNKQNSEAAYVGVIHFVGKLGDKSGSFTMTDTGEFHLGTARSIVKIVDGSGTDELIDIEGHGNYWADKENNQFELDYSFESEVLDDLTLHAALS